MKTETRGKFLRAADCRPLPNQPRDEPAVADSSKPEARSRKTGVGIRLLAVYFFVDLVFNIPDFRLVAKFQVLLASTGVRLRVRRGSLEPLTPKSQQASFCNESS